MQRYADLGDQVLYLGDAERVLGEFGDDAFDLIVTSPPYNLAIDYGLYPDRRAPDEYLRWLGDIFDALQAVLAPGGSFFLNIGSTCTAPWIAFDVANTARDFFTLQNHILWVKSLSIGERTLGHSKPIRSPRFLTHNFEHLFQFTHQGDAPIDRLALGVPYVAKSNLTRGTRGQNGDRRCAGNVWFVPYRTVRSRQEKGGHPAIFPVELVRRCLKLAGAGPATRVLDPFAGTGTTAVACRELGIPGTHLDIDPKYLALAVERLRSLPALLVSSGVEEGGAA